jgi:hypothetical protein
MCGRLRAEQVERSIIPHQPQSKLYRLFIGLGLTLVLSQLPTGQAFARIPYNHEYVSPFTTNEDPIGSTDSTVINGRVVDENNNPMQAAIVRIVIINNGKTIAGTITDTSGAFSITLDSKADIDSYYLAVKYPSYKTYTLELTKYHKKSKQVTLVKMELNVQGDMDIIYPAAYKIPLVDKFNPGHNTTIDGSQIEKMPH